ncbi:MAG TPA: type VI secretion system tip protein TssI/VgrG, partial [Geminicoccaceae bacterium]|nr:type VI secretion system tip protein TssI/VgrG [Geminicoccaceae bacterium]
MAGERAVAVETALGDALRFRRMTGREAIGTPFRYDVTLLADDLSIELERLLGTGMTVEIRTLDGARRHFHGLVANVAHLGMEGSAALYEAELRPWFWFLSRTADCRIFQEKTTLEIVTQIFEKYPMAEFDAGRLTDTLPTRVYCVQYRESDLDFVSRLLESEGIGYFFTHEAGKHTMVLADNPDGYRTLEGYAEVPYFPESELARRERDHIFEWRAAATVQPGSFVHTSYDFTKPRADLMAKRAEPMPHELAEGEVYDYPGRHLEIGAGERIARLRLEELIARHGRARGAGTAAGLAAGHRFALTQYPREDQNTEHVVVAVEHEIWDPAYRSGEPAAAEQEPYLCRLEAMPATKVFRSPCTTPSPVMRGPQTAVVTGPAGEEIHCDAHGRVKVQFHWDRLGKKDENSSCWVRASQAWAGQGYGAMVIPRIGQEVIVDFLEGDPDQPIITGRVYNAIQAPPYGLPGAKNQSGLKSNSTKGGGGSNELMLDDTKGSEKTYFHSQKDHDAVVENNETRHVKNCRTTTIDVDETITVHGQRTETVDKDETVTVHMNETRTVDMNRTDTVLMNEARTVAIAQQQTVGATRNVSVGLTQAHEIGINDSWEIGKNRAVNVHANDSLEVDKNRSAKVGDNDSLEVGKDQGVKIGKNQTVTVGEDGTVTIGKTLVITAGDEINIKTGKAMIIMKKDGSITIKGKDILIDGS